MRDGVLEDAGRLPVNRLAAAVVVDLAVLMEPIADHPVQHLIDVGALQNAVTGCPADGLLLSDEDLRLVAGLGKGFLCGDAIAMNVVAPHRKRLRDDDVLRRCTYESGDMRRRRRQYVPRGRQGSALGSGCIWHRVFLLLAMRQSKAIASRRPLSLPLDEAALNSLVDFGSTQTRFHRTAAACRAGAYLPDGGGGVPGVPTLPVPGCGLPVPGRELTPTLEAGGGGVPGVPLSPAPDCALAAVPADGGGGVPGMPTSPVADCAPPVPACEARPVPLGGGGGVPGVPLPPPAVDCALAAAPPDGGGGVPGVPTPPAAAWALSVPACEPTPPPRGGGGVPGVPMEPASLGTPVGEPASSLMIVVPLLVPEPPKSAEESDPVPG